MKVLMLSANTEKINMPVLPLGLACVAESARNAGHDVALIDLMGRQDTWTVLKEAIYGFQPEILIRQGAVSQTSPTPSPSVSWVSSGSGKRYCQRLPKFYRRSDNSGWCRLQHLSGKCAGLPGSRHGYSRRRGNRL